MTVDIYIFFLVCSMLGIAHFVGYVLVCSCICLAFLKVFSKVILFFAKATPSMRHFDLLDFDFVGLHPLRYPLTGPFFETAVSLRPSEELSDWLRKKKPVDWRVVEGFGIPQRRFNGWFEDHHWVFQEQETSDLAQKATMGVGLLI